MTNRTTVAIVVDDSVCSVDVQKQENNGTPRKKVVKQGNILRVGNECGILRSSSIRNVLRVRRGSPVLSRSP
ncbi:MAG: hypothetical protein M3044_14085 [Thermoproteota archaeon]|nr:hypothetical protein [Thermoproteota archaeon]